MNTFCIIYRDICSRIFNNFCEEETEYVPVASNNYKNFLDSIAENNLFSNAANLTTIKTLPTNDTTMFLQRDKQDVKSID
jgi:hypothetical protein